MPIYKDYNQAALDKQYNNRARVPNFAQIVTRWQQQSEALRQQSNTQANLQYGPHARELIDIFPAERANAPMQVFFHGGYWQAMEKDVFHFIAGGFVGRGITTVLVNYPLAPEASMDEIVDSCRRAMIWLYRHGAKYQGNPDSIFISGHSAGGHIVAMLMATDWPAMAKNLPKNLIKGGCAISGLFNLTPIRLSYLNEVLGMDTEMAARNSPVSMSPASESPLIISVGALESEEYHAQSRELYISWSQKGIPAIHLPVPKANHFSVLDHLVDTKAALNRAIVEQMGVTYSA